VENAHLITSDVQSESVRHVTFAPIQLNQPVSATASVIKSKSIALELDSEQLPALTCHVPKTYEIPLKPFKGEE